MAPRATGGGLGRIARRWVMKNPGKQADARPQPPRRRKLSGFLRVMGLAAVVLAVPALGYGYYVIAQVQDVRERSVRTLAHSACLLYTSDAADEMT